VNTDIIIDEFLLFLSIIWDYIGAILWV
jgi:hypothetical protein